MAGAFSLFLGMLGLGAAGAVSAGQNAKIKKADYQYGCLLYTSSDLRAWYTVLGRSGCHALRSKMCIRDRYRTGQIHVMWIWFAGPHFSRYKSTNQT